MTSQRYFSGKVIRILSPNRIDVSLNLEFDLTLRHAFVLEDLSLQGMSDEERNAAKHCLILLLGGKKVCVRPDPRLRDRWGSIPDLRARVFRLDSASVFSSCVGYVDVLSEVGSPALDVSAYMLSLATKGYEPQEVLSLTRKRANEG